MIRDLIDVNMGMLFDSVIETSLDTALKCTVQFFYVNRNRPVADGSGILFTIEDRFFVITAAHVFGNFDVEYFIPLTGNKQIFVHPHQVKSTKDQPNISNDKYDIAAFELDDIAVRTVTDEGMSFLTIKDTKNNHIDAGHQYGVVGFVANKTKIRPPDTLTSYVFKYLTHLETTFQYDKYGLNPKYHIAISFDGKAIVSESNPNPHSAPELKGISGCGLWVIGDVIKNVAPLIKFDVVANRKILGIITENKKDPNNKVLIATKIGHAVNFIIQSFGLARRANPPLIHKKPTSPYAKEPAS